MSSTPTIKDIAHELNIHYSTVSLALRNSPKIPEVTREKVRRTAERLGYVPEPFLKALASYRRREKPPAYRGGIAILTDRYFDEEPGNRDMPWGSLVARSHQLFYKAFEKRAKDLGFSTHLFLIQSIPNPATSLPRILRSRGIECIVFAPVRTPRDQWNFDLARFSVVTMGYSIQDSPYHHVVQNQFENTRRHIQEILKRGYRRIALHLNAKTDQRTRGRIRAAFLLEASRNEGALLPEILNEVHYTSRQWRSWYKRAKPDALLCLEYTMVEVREAGIRVPEQLACSSMALLDTENMAGMDEQSDAVVYQAIERVVSLWQMGERGTALHPTHLLVDGVFVEGPSIATKA